MPNNAMPAPTAPRAGPPGETQAGAAARAAYLRLQAAILDEGKPTPPARVFRKAGGSVAGVMRLRRDAPE